MEETETQKNLTEYSVKLDGALKEFKEIVISSKRLTFWERYGNIIIPTIISTIIGVCTFYAAFNLSEYKIGVLMEERTAINRSIGNIEDRMIAIDLSNSAGDIFESYTKQQINKIQTNLEDIKKSLILNSAEHGEIKSNISTKIHKLETRIIKLEKN